MENFYSLNFRTETSREQIFFNLKLLAKEDIVNTPEEGRKIKIIQWLNALEACETGTHIPHDFIKDIVDTMDFKRLIVKN